MAHGHTLIWSILTCSLALASGCRSAHFVRDADYALLESSLAQSWNAVEPVAEALSPVADQLAGPHPLENYIRFALAQNADIQAARKHLEAIALRVPQAASLPDPTLGMTVHAEQVQTAAGQQEVSLMANQRIPWPGKLATRAALAEEEAEQARAELAVAELAVIEMVKRAYYELYFLQRAIRITEQDRRLLRTLEEIANEQYRVKRNVSQQDLLRVQLEIMLRDDELIRLRQQLASARAELARQLHVSPETPLLALDRLPPEQIPGDLDRLYRQAVASRPELHAHLAAVMRDRQAAELARLNYYPDVTLGLTWIDTASAGLSGVANGRDAFLLGASVNLPVYRKRLSAGVREAEARTVASARQYDSMRDQTLSDVKDLFAQATSQHQLLELFQLDIIPKAAHTLEISKQAYVVAEVDIQQVIDNWRRLLQFQISEQRLEAQLRQSLARLEQVLGGLSRGDAAGPLPPPAAPSVP